MAGTPPIEQVNPIRLLSSAKQSINLTNKSQRIHDSEDNDGRISPDELYQL